MYTGPRGGKYVLSVTKEKLYVPRTATHWTFENGRWKVWLSDGRKMLYPKLR
jgi:hypothetical protein